jgi:hypothetical protein
MNKTSQLPREFNNIGIKPTLNENMDETYKNRREHLKKWMNNKLLSDPKSEIKIGNSYEKYITANTTKESQFTIVNYNNNSSDILPKFIAKNKIVGDILNPLNLVYMSASGTGNNCAFHSFLQAISPLFRALDNNTKDKIASAFRLEYIKFVIINDAGADMQTKPFCNNPNMQMTEKSKIRDFYFSGLDEFSPANSGITNFVYFDSVNSINKTREPTPDSFIEINSYFFGYNLIIYTTSQQVLDAEAQGIQRSIEEKLNPIHKVNDTIFIWNQGNAHFETVGYIENVSSASSAAASSVASSDYKFVFKDDSQLVKDINKVAIRTNICDTTIVVPEPKSVKINRDNVTIFKTDSRDRTVLQTKETGCLIIYCFTYINSKYTNASLTAALQKLYKQNIQNFCFIIFDYCKYKKDINQPIKIYLVLKFNFDNNDIQNSDLVFLKDMTPQELQTNNFDINIPQILQTTHRLILDNNNNYIINSLSEVNKQSVPVLKTATPIKKEQVYKREEKHLDPEIEMENQVKEYYKNINKLMNNPKLKVNKVGEMKLKNEIISGQSKFDVTTDIQTYINNNVIKKDMFVLIENNVYMIVDFGSIIVNRNFEKNYKVDTVIIFYSVEKEKAANIITLILKKYNEKFDENENNETNKIISKNNLDFKKLLLEVDKVEKETKCASTKELFLNNTNVTNIHDMNFIQDINMVRSIVKYRKLEIKKQIRIISLSIEVYKYVLIKIKCFDYFRDNNNTLKLNMEGFNMEELEKDRKKCIEIFNQSVFNNAYFLQDTLCRYIELENKLKQFTEKTIKK